MAEDFRQGFRSLVSSKLLVSLIGTAALPLVVRVLGPDGYGDYTFLLSVFAMLMLVVSPAVTEGVQKFVAEERADAFWREHVVRFYLRVAVVLGAVGALALAALTWAGVVGWFFDPRFDLFFYILAAYVVTSQMRAFTRHTLLGLGLEQYSESLAVLKKVATLGVGLGLGVLGFGVAGFLVGHVVAATLFTVIGFLVLRRELSLPETLRSGPSSVSAGTLLTFNGLNVVLVVLLQSLFHTDVMLIRVMADAEQTGFYKAALVLAEYLWLVPLALQQLLLHSASNLWSQGRRDRIQTLASNLMRYVFLVTSVMAIGIALLADEFVPLYFGQEFVASVDPLLYLIPGALGFALVRPLYGINQATGRLLPLVGAVGVAAVLNVTLNYLLIPVYGITGAAVATSTSYGSMFVLQVACARYFGYHPLRGVRPGRLLGTVALAGPGIYAVDLVIEGPLVSLVVVPVAGLLVFVASALLVGAIDVAELRATASLVPGPVRRRVRALVFDERESSPRD